MDKISRRSFSPRGRGRRHRCRQPWPPPAAPEALLDAAGGGQSQPGQVLAASACERSWCQDHLRPVPAAAAWMCAW